MVAAVIQTLSQRRFDTYLHAAGHNQQRALNLYEWNARLGASFHMPIQATEVAFRNRVNHALMAEFGCDWWGEPGFLSLIDHDRQRDLKTVKDRLKRKKVNLETDQVVASLSFGFWVGMMQPKYNPAVWGQHLRTSFPCLPADKGRGDLFDLAGRVANFRNRISHHEPLIREDATQKFSDVMRMLVWLCVDTEKWVRPLCDVPTIVRQKP